MIYSNQDIDNAEALHRHFHGQISTVMDKLKFNIDPEKQVSYPDIMNSCLITHLSHLERRIAELEKQLPVTIALPDDEKKL